VTVLARTRRRWRRIAGRPSLLLDAKTRRWLRAAHWLIPVGLSAWAWDRLGKPGGGQALAITTAVMVAAWPLVILWCWYGLPAAIRAIEPREHRARRRNKIVHLSDGTWGKRPRPPVPQRLQDIAFRAYRHRCVSCRERTGLQIEHIMPWSRGGLNSMWNFTLLCAEENNLKSDYWVYRGGRVYYRHRYGGGTPDQRAAAAVILARERRRRANPVRWLAIAWLLAVA